MAGCPSCTAPAALPVCCYQHDSRGKPHVPELWIFVCNQPTTLDGGWLMVGHPRWRTTHVPAHVGSRPVATPPALATTSLDSTRSDAPRRHPPSTTSRYSNDTEPGTTTLRDAVGPSLSSSKKPRSGKANRQSQCRRREARGSGEQGHSCHMGLVQQGARFGNHLRSPRS
jgi:hypothetical protein